MFPHILLPDPREEVRLSQVQLAPGGELAARPLSGPGPGPRSPRCHPHLDAEPEMILKL